MDEQTKLILGLQQVNNLSELIKGNEYENHLNRNLISIQVELQRQLSHYVRTESKS
jgi:hypothetical protein